MIQVDNVNNQLVITWANNLREYYAFEDMKSVTPYTGPSGDFIVINFINENRNSSLRIPFIEIDNQPGWTTSLIAAAAISSWMDTSIGGGLATEATLQQVEANTTGLATEATLQSVDTNTSTTATNTTALARTPNLIRPTGAGNINTVSAQFYSVSVANVGSANGLVLSKPIKPGEVLNFSADALNNYFTDFDYDATGTEFIIIFVS